MTLAQETDAIVSESTTVVARGMDELRLIYDAACKKHKIADDELSGRGPQEALFYRTQESELSVLMAYLVEKGVAVSHIITSIKCATPELYRQSLQLCIAQHKAYEQQQSVKAGEQQESAQKAEQPVSTMPLFRAPQIGALV